MGMRSQNNNHLATHRQFWFLPLHYKDGENLTNWTRFCNEIETHVMSFPFYFKPGRTLRQSRASKFDYPRILFSWETSAPEIGKCTIRRLSPLFSRASKSGETEQGRRGKGYKEGQPWRLLRFLSFSKRRERMTDRQDTCQTFLSFSFSVGLSVCLSVCPHFFIAAPTECIHH